MGQGLKWLRRKLLPKSTDTPPICRPPGDDYAFLLLLLDTLDEQAKTHVEFAALEMALGGTAQRQKVIAYLEALLEHGHYVEVIRRLLRQSTQNDMIVCV